MTSDQNIHSRERLPLKLLIIILSIIVIVNIVIAFSYHMLYSSSLIHGASGVHLIEHRVIMIYHSLSAPSLAIVTLFMLKIFELRKKVIKPIKYIVFIGGVCAGIGATFWAYFNGPLGFTLHHFFVGGLVLIFFSALLLFYGLIPGDEAKQSEYFKEVPKIGGINILSLSALIVVGGMLVFALFGLTAALIMLTQEPPVHFFFIELIYVVNRGDPKTIYHELASFHMRLISALFLTGILILLFRYTKAKGKAARIGLWLLLPGTIAMTAGYFLMIFMGKSANAILMPARALILFTGVILAFYGWNQVSKEELGDEYRSASLGKKIIALLKNPLRFGMYLPFFLAGLVVVIPGLIIVGNLEAYRANLDVELSYAFGHPHVLATLGAIVIFCLVAHNFISNENRFLKIVRKVIGWLIVASLLIAFPAAPFYFLRSPTNALAETAIKSIILVGLFILFFAVLMFLVLIVYQAIKNREKFTENIKPLVNT